MKHTICLILVLCLALCLVGCGAEEAAPAAEDNFTFLYKNTEITIHALAEPVITALGEPKTYTEAPSCAFEGLDKTYFYGSFYLTTYPAEDGDRIQGLWFADDTVTTPENITIGSSRTEVEAAYGAFEGDACVLDKQTSRLTILLTGDTVSGVRYDAVLE